MERKIQVLLAEDLRNSKSALEKALKKESEIDFLGVSRDGVETIEAVQKLDVDLLIMDLILSRIDGLEVMQRIKLLNLPNPPKIILVTALSSEQIINDAAKLGAVHVFLKPCDAAYTAKRVIEVYKNVAMTIVQVSGQNFSLHDIQLIIVRALRDVGMPPQLLGYEYLRSAILASLQQQDMLRGVTTQLYPKLAEIHKSTPVKVERSIRHAIETTWSRSTIESLHKTFGYTVDRFKGRPTNSEFIARMTDLVMMRCV